MTTNLLNLKTISVLILSVFLIGFGKAIAYAVATASYALTGSLTLENFALIQLNLDLLAWIPRIVGLAAIVCVGVYTRFKLNASVTKRQIIKLSTVCTLLLCFAMVAEVPMTKAATIATGGYILDTPLPIADWYIGKYSNGNYFAINGSNWDNLVAGIGSTAWAAYTGNYTKIEELVLAATTSGTVYLKEVPFNIALSVPSNVNIIQNLNGVTQTFSGPTQATDKSTILLAQPSGATEYVDIHSSPSLGIWDDAASTFLLSNGTTGLIYRNGTTPESDKGSIVMQTTTNFVNFTTPTLIYTDPTYDCRNIAVGTTVEGYILVAFYKYDYSTLTGHGTYTMFYNGITWSTPTILPTWVGGSATPSPSNAIIAVPSIGYVLPVYMTNGSMGTVGISISNDLGHTWQAPTTVVPWNTTYKVGEPSIIYVPEKNGLLVEMRRYETGTELSLMQLTGTISNKAITWGSLTPSNLMDNISGGRDSVQTPSLVISNGYFVCFWSDYSGSAFTQIVSAKAPIDNVWNDALSWSDFSTESFTGRDVTAIMSLPNERYVVYAPKQVDTNTQHYFCKVYNPAGVLYGNDLIRSVTTCTANTTFTFNNLTLTQGKTYTLSVAWKGLNTGSNYTNIYFNGDLNNSNYASTTLTTSLTNFAAPHCGFSYSNAYNYMNLKITIVNGFVQYSGTCAYDNGAFIMTVCGYYSVSTSTVSTISISNLITNGFFASAQFILRQET
jgi:hypothetical protein